MGIPKHDVVAGPTAQLHQLLQRRPVLHIPRCPGVPEVAPTSGRA
jgi:hypothetical protein